MQRCESDFPKVVTWKARNEDGKEAQNGRICEVDPADRMYSSGYCQTPLSLFDWVLELYNYPQSVDPASAKSRRWSGLGRGRTTRLLTLNSMGLLDERSISLLLNELEVEDLCVALVGMC